YGWAGSPLVGSPLTAGVRPRPGSRRPRPQGATRDRVTLPAGRDERPPSIPSRFRPPWSAAPLARPREGRPGAIRTPRSGTPDGWGETPLRSEPRPPSGGTAPDPTGSAPEGPSARGGGSGPRPFRRPNAGRPMPTPPSMWPATARRRGRPAGRAPGPGRGSPP